MLTPQTHDTRSYARLVNRMGWALVLFFTIFQTLNTLLLLAFEDASIGAGTTGEVLAYGILTPIFYMLPFFAAGLLFYIFCRKEDTARPRLELHLPKMFPLMVLAGLAINTAAAYLNSILAQSIGYVIPEELLSGRYDSPGAIIMFMGTGLAPAFAEEFLFRGVIYGNLRRYGRTQAILLSSLAFSFMHQNLGQIFYTFVCGIVLALMYEYTGSIWCSIFFHLFNNELAVVTEVLYYSVLGDSGYPLLELWDIFIFALGLVAVFILFVHTYTRKKRKAQVTSGYFGQATTTTEDCDRPLTVGFAARAALTPGVITFCVLSILEMISRYFIILGYNSGALS